MDPQALLDQQQADQLLAWAARQGFPKVFPRRTVLWVDGIERQVEILLNPSQPEHLVVDLLDGGEDLEISRELLAQACEQACSGQVVRDADIDWVQVTTSEGEEVKAICFFLRLDDLWLCLAASYLAYPVSVVRTLQAAALSATNIHEALGLPEIDY